MSRLKNLFLLASILTVFEISTWSCVSGRPSTSFTKVRQKLSDFSPRYERIPGDNSALTENIPADDSPPPVSVSVEYSPPTRSKSRGKIPLTELTAGDDSPALSSSPPTGSVSRGEIPRTELPTGDTSPPAESIPGDGSPSAESISRGGSPFAENIPVDGSTPADSIPGDNLQSSKTIPVEDLTPTRSAGGDNFRLSRDAEGDLLYTRGFAGGNAPPTGGIPREEQPPTVSSADEDSQHGAIPGLTTEESLDVVEKILQGELQPVMEHPTVDTSALPDVPIPEERDASSRNTPKVLDPVPFTNLPQVHDISSTSGAIPLVKNRKDIVVLGSPSSVVDAPTEYSSHADPAKRPTGELTSVFVSDLKPDGYSSLPHSNTLNNLSSPSTSVVPSVPIGVTNLKPNGYSSWPHINTLDDFPASSAIVFPSVFTGLTVLEPDDYSSLPHINALDDLPTHSGSVFPFLPMGLTDLEPNEYISLLHVNTLNNLPESSAKVVPTVPISLIDLERIYTYGSLPYIITLNDSPLSSACVASSVSADDPGKNPSFDLSDQHSIKDSVAARDFSEKSLGLKDVRGQEVQYIPRYDTTAFFESFLPPADFNIPSVETVPNRLYNFQHSDEDPLNTYFIHQLSPDEEYIPESSNADAHSNIPGSSENIMPGSLESVTETPQISSGSANIPHTSDAVPPLTEYVPQSVQPNGNILFDTDIHGNVFASHEGDLPATLDSAVQTQQMFSGSANKLPVRGEVPQLTKDLPQTIQSTENNPGISDTDTQGNISFTPESVRPATLDSAVQTQQMSPESADLPPISDEVLLSAQDMLHQIQSNQNVPDTHDVNIQDNIPASEKTRPASTIGSVMGNQQITSETNHSSSGESVEPTTTENLPEQSQNQDDVQNTPASSDTNIKDDNQVPKNRSESTVNANSKLQTPVSSIVLPPQKIETTSKGNKEMSKNPKLDPRIYFPIPLARKQHTDKTTRFYPTRTAIQKRPDSAETKRPDFEETPYSHFKNVDEELLALSDVSDSELESKSEPDSRSFQFSEEIDSDQGDKFWRKMEPFMDYEGEHSSDNSQLTRQTSTERLPTDFLVENATYSASISNTPGILNTMRIPKFKTYDSSKVLPDNPSGGLKEVQITKDRFPHNSQMSPVQYDETSTLTHKTDYAPNGGGKVLNVDPGLVDELSEDITTMRRSADDTTPAEKPRYEDIFTIPPKIPERDQLWKNSKLEEEAQQSKTIGTSAPAISENDKIWKDFELEEEAQQPKMNYAVEFEDTEKSQIWKHSELEEKAQESKTIDTIARAISEDDQIRSNSELEEGVQQPKINYAIALEVPENGEIWKHSELEMETQQPKTAHTIAPKIPENDQIWKNSMSGDEAEEPKTIYTSSTKIPQNGRIWKYSELEEAQLPKRTYSVAPEITENDQIWKHSELELEAEQPKTAHTIAPEILENDQNFKNSMLGDEAEEPKTIYTSSTKIPQNDQISKYYELKEEAQQPKTTYSVAPKITENGQIWKHSGLEIEAQQPKTAHTIAPAIPENDQNFKNSMLGDEAQEPKTIYTSSTKIPQNSHIWKYSELEEEGQEPKTTYSIATEIPENGEIWKHSELEMETQQPKAARTIAPAIPENDQICKDSMLGDEAEEPKTVYTSSTKIPQNDQIWKHSELEEAQLPETTYSVAPQITENGEIWKHSELEMETQQPKAAFTVAPEISENDQIRKNSMLGDKAQEPETIYSSSTKIPQNSQIWKYYELKEEALQPKTTYSVASEIPKSVQIWKHSELEKEAQEPETIDEILEETNFREDSQEQSTCDDILSSNGNIFSGNVGGSDDLRNLELSHDDLRFSEDANETFTTDEPLLVEDKPPQILALNLTTPHNQRESSSETTDLNSVEDDNISSSLKSFDHSVAKKDDPMNTLEYLNESEGSAIFSPYDGSQPGHLIDVDNLKSSGIPGDPGNLQNPNENIRVRRSSDDSDPLLELLLSDRASKNHESADTSLQPIQSSVSQTISMKNANTTSQNSGNSIIPNQLSPATSTNPLNLTTASFPKSTLTPTTSITPSPPTATTTQTPPSTSTTSAPTVFYALTTSTTLPPSTTTLPPLTTSVPSITYEPLPTPIPETASTLTPFTSSSAPTNSTAPEKKKKKIWKIPFYPDNIVMSSNGSVHLEPKDKSAKVSTTPKPLLRSRFTHEELQAARERLLKRFQSRRHPVPIPDATNLHSSHFSQPKALVPIIPNSTVVYAVVPPAQSQINEDVLTYVTEQNPSQTPSLLYDSPQERDEARKRRLRNMVGLAGDVRSFLSDRTRQAVHTVGRIVGGDNDKKKGQ